MGRRATLLDPFTWKALSPALSIGPKNVIFLSYNSVFSQALSGLLQWCIERNREVPGFALSIPFRYRHDMKLPDSLYLVGVIAGVVTIARDVLDELNENCCTSALKPWMRRIWFDVIGFLLEVWAILNSSYELVRLRIELSLVHMFSKRVVLSANF